MITYFYWGLVAIMSFAAFAALLKLNQWKAGIVAALMIAVIGVLSYFFYFENIFVKRWGGVMSISVPEGQMHMGATWKDEHLWVENYDPKTNTCYFNEYSRGNLLQGKVTIKNCNPLLPAQ